MPITAPTVTTSIIGPIRAEIQAQIETCLAVFYTGAAATRQHCFLADGTALQTAEKPCAVLAIAGGKGISYDIYTRVRPVLPMVIEMECDRNTQTGATLPNEQCDRLFEMLQKVFYVEGNYSRLSDLAGFIDLTPVNASLAPDGKYAVLEYSMELDYQYAP